MWCCNVQLLVKITYLLFYKINKYNYVNFLFIFIYVKMWCKVQIWLNSILNPCTEMRLPHSTWAARCSGSGSSRAPAPESPSCRADRVWRRSSRWTTSRCQNSTKEHLLFCVTKQTYIDKGIQVLQMKIKKVLQKKMKVLWKNKCAVCKQK